MKDADVELCVTNVERFATHDGPGIRTTVFLKGCLLHCPWCANPETQSRDPLASCAAKRRAVRGDEAARLRGIRRGVGDVLDEVERDRDYYEISGGGLTVSGGEPLMLVDGARALLREAKARGLDTAVETTGNVSRASLEETIGSIDYVLYDIKHLDDERLKEVVGSDGELVRSNLIWLAQLCPEKINVRIPVIPTFNYEPETLYKMIDWIQEVGVSRVNLLPYHTLGLGKYEKLGRSYTYPRKSLQDEDLIPYHKYALSLGMESKIGA